VCDTCGQYFRSRAQQTTEGSKDDPVLQRSQGSTDDHAGAFFERNVFDIMIGCSMHLWTPSENLNNSYYSKVIVVGLYQVHGCTKNASFIKSKYFSYSVSSTLTGADVRKG